MAELRNIRAAFAVLTLFLILALLLPGCGRRGGLPPPGEGGENSPTQPIKMELAVSDLPTLGKPVELTATFGIRDWYPQDKATNVTATIIFPDDIELVSGNPKWQGDVLRGKTYQMKVTMRAVKTGVWEVRASAFSPPYEGFGGGTGYLYISVTDTGATVSRRRPEAPRGYIWGAEKLDPSRIPPLPPRPAPTEPEHPPPPRPSGKTTSTPAGTLTTLKVTGRFWVYVSKNELPPPPQPGEPWQVRGDDLVGADWAAVHIYDGNGNYLNGATTSAFGYPAIGMLTSRVGWE
ncbi:MAG: hypothetical protein V1737_01165 [Chloroflexota bacterium]